MRSRTWKLVQYAAPLGLIPLFACLAPPVESPRTKVSQETKVKVAQDVKNKVDLLFMIDNSGSMAPKQKELLARVPRLIQALEGFGKMGSQADYHIGVVTSDLGAPGGAGGCSTTGQGGQLQIAPGSGCIADTTPMGCKSLIPSQCSQFALKGSGPNGGNFIDYDQINGTTNISGGLDVATAFTCMAMTGQKGCGLESQLESVYRALHNPPAMNGGFLREEALLVVVFVTDEDDCSVPMGSDLFVNDSAHFMQYGELNSFRCTRFGVVCNNQPVPYMAASFPGSECSSAPNLNAMGPGKLIDVQKYIDFFTKPFSEGGVKIDPSDVILTAIAAPPVDIKVKMVDRGIPTGECPSMVMGETRTAQCALLEHSCVANGKPDFFGDPAFRINQVLNSVSNKNLTSICNTDYTDAIDQLAQLIVSHIGVGCINAPVVKRTNDNGDQVPDCIVSDVIATKAGQEVHEIPSCVENGGKTPCWRLDDKLKQYNMQNCFQSPIPQSCKLPPSCQPVVQAAHVNDDMSVTCAGTGKAADPGKCELTSVTIDRGSAPPPDHSYASVSCTTLASSSK